MHKSPAHPWFLSLLAVLAVLSAAVLVPAQATDPSLRMAEAAFERREYEAIVELLLPAWEQGSLQDARALFLLSRGCARSPRCRDRTGRITRAAADAGDAGSMLNLANSVVTRFESVRFPDLELEPTVAYRYALAARDRSQAGPMRERADELIEQLARRIPSRERASLQPIEVAPSGARPAPSGDDASPAPGIAADSSAMPPGTDGPFGLRFGMSQADVSLQAVETDKYGRDSLSSPNKHYSCMDTMTWPFNGEYNPKAVSDAQRSQHLAMRLRWLDALEQAEPGAATLADTLETGVVQRLGVNFGKADSALTDVDVRAYATGSGTTLCAAFFQDRLFRVTANLSGKRDLIPALVEKVRGEYGGAPYEYWQRSGDSSRIHTHRWAGHPRGVWVTITHEDYVRPKNVDWSKAYAFGGRPEFPTPSQRPAEADYAYPPIFAQALVWHGRQKARAAEERALEDEKQQREALDEF